MYGVTITILPIIGSLKVDNYKITIRYQRLKAYYHGVILLKSTFFKPVFANIDLNKYDIWDRDLKG